MKHITQSEWDGIFRLRDHLAKQLIDYELFDYQKEFSNKVIKSVIENKGETVVGCMSRQIGKTSSVVVTVIFLLLFYFSLCRRYGIRTTPKFNIGIFAPQLEQAKTAFYMLREYLRKLDGQGFDFTFDSFNGDTVIMHSMREPAKTVYCMSASPTSKQESKTLNVIIYDEAVDIEDKVVDRAISPMGSSTNATEVWIGVAGYKKCRFYHLIEQLPEKQKVIIPYNKVLEERRKRYEENGNEIMLNYQKHIDKRLMEIGEDSDEFSTQYKLNWILERGQFITYDDLMKLEKEYDVPDTFYGSESCYGGIDWGKASDSTVFTIMDSKCRVVEWYEWQGDDYSSQINEITELIKTKYKSMRMVHCDSTATQDMAVDILRANVQHLGVKVIPVIFTPVSKDEMYKNLARLMQDQMMGGHIVVPAPLKFPKKDSLQKNKFIKQMLDLQKEIKNEKWRCQSPQGAGYHDDFACSLATCALAFSPKKQVQYVPTIG